MDGGLYLDWDPPVAEAGDVTGYAISRSVGSASLAALVADTESTDTDYTDTTATTPGETYGYQVKAIRSGAGSQASNVAAAQLPDPAAWAPGNLTAQTVDGGVSLSWDAPAEDSASVTGYEILRAVGSGEFATLVADTQSTGATYSDSSATTPGETYRYKVVALRDGERSQASNVAGVVVPALESIPPPDDETPLVSASQLQFPVVWGATMIVGQLFNSEALGYGTDRENFGFDFLSSNSFTFLEEDYVVVAVSGPTATAQSSQRKLTLMFDGATVGTEANRELLLLRLTEDSTVKEYKIANGTQNTADNTPAFGDVAYVQWDATNSDLGWATSDTILLQLERVNNDPTGVPTISGTAKKGQMLTADASGIDDADGIVNVAFSYQWVRVDGEEETDIENATGSTYELTQEDVGKTIKVTVSFTDDVGFSESVSSVATGTVEGLLGFTVSHTLLTVAEGGNGEYTVVLDAEPTADVTINLTLTTLGGTNVSLSATSLTFTTTDWATPQTVTVSQAEDDDGAPRSETITHAVGSGSAAVYVGLGTKALVLQ